MFNVLLLLVVCIILGYSSWYDLKHKLVQWFIPIVLCVCSMTYVVLGYISLVNALSVCVLLVFFFGLPTLFGFGVGDLLILLCLSVFIGSLSNLYWFLLCFFVITVFWSTMWIWRYKKMDQTKKIKELLFKSFPFVPVIAVSFYLTILSVLLHV